MHKLIKNVVMLSLIVLFGVDAMYSSEDVNNLQQDTKDCQFLTKEENLVYNVNFVCFKNTILNNTLVCNLNNGLMRVVDVENSSLQMLGYLMCPQNFETSRIETLSIFGYFKDTNGKIAKYKISEHFDRSGKSIAFLQPCELGTLDKVSNWMADNAKRREENRIRRLRDAEQRNTGDAGRLAVDGMTDFGVNIATAGSNLLQCEFSGFLSATISCLSGGWAAVKHGSIYCWRRVSTLCRRNEQ